MLARLAAELSARVKQQEAAQLEAEEKALDSDGSDGAGKAAASSTTTSAAASAPAASAAAQGSPTVASAETAAAAATSPPSATAQDSAADLRRRAENMARWKAEQARKAMEAEEAAARERAMAAMGTAPMKPRMSLGSKGSAFKRKAPASGFGGDDSSDEDDTAAEQAAAAAAPPKLAPLPMFSFDDEDTPAAAAAPATAPVVDDYDDIDAYLLTLGETVKQEELHLGNDPKRAALGAAPADLTAASPYESDKSGSGRPHWHRGNTISLDEVMRAQAGKSDQWQGETTADEADVSIRLSTVLLTVHHAHCSACTASTV